MHEDYTNHRWCLSENSFMFCLLAILADLQEIYILNKCGRISFDVNNVTLVTTGPAGDGEANIYNVEGCVCDPTHKVTGRSMWRWYKWRWRGRSMHTIIKWCNDGRSHWGCRGCNKILCLWPHTVMMADPTKDGGTGKGGCVCEDGRFPWRWRGYNRRLCL